MSTSSSPSPAPQSEPAPPQPDTAAAIPTDSENDSFAARVRRTIFGKPRDIHDSRVFHHISLIPFLAWVGLGADGLSSSAYGPEEAFKNLGEHTYLAVALAGVMAATVF